MATASPTDGESREDLRPAIVAPGLRTVRSAEGRLLWPRGVDDVLRKSGICQHNGMQTMRRELLVDWEKKRRQDPGRASGGQVIAYLQTDGEMNCFWG